MTLRIGLAEIDVLDLDAAWQFYVETLQIPGRSIGHGGEVEAWGVGRGKPFELDLGDGHTVLVYRGSILTPDAYPNGTGVKLGFFTDDIVTTVATWRARGVEFIPIEWSLDASGIASSPFGPFIAFRDPFGNVHELLQPNSAPGPHAWQYADLSGQSGAIGAAGEPVMQRTDDGTFHVVYRGSDDHVHKISFGSNPRPTSGRPPSQG